MPALYVNSNVIYVLTTNASDSNAKKCKYAFQKSIVLNALRALF